MTEPGESDSTTPALPADGWYEDGVSPGQLRHWDGTRWTDEFRPIGAPKKKSRKWIWITLGSLAAIFLFILVVGIAVGSSMKPVAAHATLARATDSSSPAASPSPTPKPTPKSTPKPTVKPTSTPKSTPKPVPNPAFATQTFTGTGDNVENVHLAGRPGVLTFDCPACTDNTVVTTNGAENLLVNTIGAYHGSNLVDVQQGSVTSQITIKATGTWTLTVADLSTVPDSGTSAAGTGDAVVKFTGSFTTAAITNNGTDNFVVTGYTDTSNLAVNTIGGYSGTVQLAGPGYVQVKSTGAWTITGR